MAEPKMVDGPAHADDMQPRSMPGPISIVEKPSDIAGPAPTVLYDEASPTYQKTKRDGSVEYAGPKKRRFKSNDTRFRLQMVTTKPRMNPDGTWTSGESRFVQFRPHPQGGGICVTTDEEEILAVEDCDAYGASVYDLDAMEKSIEQKRLDYIETAVESDPKLMRRLAAKLGVTDFLEKSKDPGEGAKGDGDKAPKGKK